MSNVETTGNAGLNTLVRAREIEITLAISPDCTMQQIEDAARIFLSGYEDWKCLSITRSSIILDKVRVTFQPVSAI